MSTLTLLVIILIVLALGGMPNVFHHSYGYWPSGGVGLLLIIVLILALAGRL